MKKTLTHAALIAAAKNFCGLSHAYTELFGVTDGKAIGTFIEHAFQNQLAAQFDLQIGNSASGLDLPMIETDIKVTSVRQPQSSSPFRSARQKVYGLGYNLLFFVYDKQDNARTKKAKLDFVSCAFIESSCTGDYRTTRNLLQILANDAMQEEIAAYLNDSYLLTDEAERNALADEIMRTPPTQGYLGTWLKPEWRTWYNRVIELDEPVAGIVKVVQR
ncbi:MAG: restriction endonuclease [Chloroflexi bacterium]|nr:restriction endonuclease [Chloroflexota bacterium]